MIKAYIFEDDFEGKAVVEKREAEITLEAMTKYPELPKDVAIGKYKSELFPAIKLTEHVYPLHPLPTSIEQVECGVCGGGRVL